MLILRRSLLIVGLLCVLLAGFVVARFGSALTQEGNPAPILAAILQLELMDHTHVQTTQTEYGTRYVSKNTGVSRLDVIRKFMEDKGWVYKEQLGSGLIFDNGEQTVVVGTRQYSKHYILWNIPEL